MRRTTIALLSFFAAGIAFAPRAGAWPFVLNGAGNEFDIAYSVAVDLLGNPVVVGTLYTADPETSFIVSNLDAATGAELWRRQITGTSHVFDAGREVKIDAAGNIVVTGTTMGNFTDFTVAKLTAGTGVPIWQTDLNGDGNNGTAYDGGYALDFDAAGDVLAAGYTHITGGTFNIQITTAKLSGATGEELWRTSIGSASDSEDYPRSIAADPAGNAFVLGYLTDPLYTTVVAKLAAADGAVLWRRDVRGTATGYGENFPAKILSTASGDAIVAGQLHNTGEVVMWVARLSGSDGTDVWSREISGPFGNSSDAALDGSGNVVVAGRIGSNFAVVKFDSADGTELWRRVLPGTPQIENFVADGATAVAVTSTGDVIAGGILDSDFTVIKLSGADGSIAWQYAYDAPNEEGYGVAYDVAVDAAGNPVAGGYVDFETGTEDDLFVVHLDGATGYPLGCGNGTLDPGEVCDDANTISGDGCDAVCVPTACGNKFVSPDEQCDDGNTEAGDGCSPSCVREECGNGITDVNEDCDDGNNIDGDGCEGNCLLPTCVGGAAIENPKVTLKYRRGLGKIAVRGTLAFAAGTPATGVQPTLDGAQIKIEDLGTPGPVLDLTRRTSPIPPESASCHPGTDIWRTRGTSQVYTNNSGQLPPACAPGSSGGLDTLKFTDRRATGLGVGVVAKARGFAMAAPVGPLAVTVVLGASAAHGVDGACAVHVFPPSACVLSATGTSLKCR